MAHLDLRVCQALRFDIVGLVLDVFSGLKRPKGWHAGITETYDILQGH